jgi:Protein of unknown function (DUF2283)
MLRSPRATRTSRVILDYDADGNLVSLEILDASKRVTETRRIEFETVGRETSATNESFCCHRGPRVRELPRTG